MVMIGISGNCAAAELSLFETSLLQKMNFFDGTLRRDMKEVEPLTFLKVIYDNKSNEDTVSICSGFRVQQKNNRFFVATARHCINFDELNACDQKQIKVAPADSSGGYYFGTCKKIIASSEDEDLFIMEVQIASSLGNSSTLFESKVKETFPGYNLASYLPAAGTPLVVSGFPTDPTRQGKATITEKCEILPENAQDSIYAMPLDERARLLEIFETARSQLPEAVSEYLSKLNITQLKHNCSVYKGNSGGPARIEGTKDIVGIPHDSWLELMKSVPRYFARNLEATATFVKRHRKILEEQGIEISDSMPKVRLRPSPAELKKIKTI